jgi:hypothetical protein
MTRAERPSGDPPASWRAGALVYAGRRDPTWDVSAGAADTWVRTFDALERSRAAVPDQARLGYRGVWLLAPDGRRWDAYDGVAWIAEERRLDSGRALERALLETAPADALPGDWNLWIPR